MSNQPSPRADGLRAMREARYEAEQARQKAEKPAKEKTVRRAPAKPTRKK